jgi:hypothetical protein
MLLWMQAGPTDVVKRAAGVQQLGSTQQFLLQLQQSLPKQAFYSSRDSLLSHSSLVLQQLRQAIATSGVYASLPTTADSFSRATAQTLFDTSERHMTSQMLAVALRRHCRMVLPACRHLTTNTVCRDTNTNKSYKRLLSRNAVSSCRLSPDHSMHAQPMLWRLLVGHSEQFTTALQYRTCRNAATCCMPRLNL